MIYDIQKSNMWKRISAYIFDSILLVILAVGVAFLLSGMLGYTKHTEAREDVRNKFEIKYGVEFDISQSDYENMSETERAHFDDAYKTFVTDPEVNRIDVLVINLSLIIAVFSILIPCLILQFLIPLKLKNGQTLGKKIFGIAVMRIDGIRISPSQLFVRSVLGKYTLETMLPILLALMFFFGVMPFAAVMGIALILLIQIIFILVSKLRTPIHDRIAGTVTVDLASQLIFDSTDELIEYQKRIHAEAAEKAEY